MSRSIQAGIDRARANRRKKLIINLLVLVAAVFIFNTVASRGQDTARLLWSDTQLTVIDPSGVSSILNYRDIKGVHFVEGFDFGVPVGGSETRYYRYGLWDSPSLGHYRLCAAAAVPDCIILHTKDSVWAISYESGEVTASLYESALQILAERGYQVTSGRFSSGAS